MIKERGFDLDIKNPHRIEDEHEYTSRELIEMLESGFIRSRDLLKKLNTEVL